MRRKYDVSEKVSMGKSWVCPYCEERGEHAPSCPEHEGLEDVYRNAYYAQREAHLEAMHTGRLQAEYAELVLAISRLGQRLKTDRRLEIEGGIDLLFGGTNA